jgi:hypothetical protein
VRTCSGSDWDAAAYRAISLREGGPVLRWRSLIFPYDECKIYRGSITGILPFAPDYPVRAYTL